MTKDNAAAFLPLVQALADGKTLQFRHAIDGWADMDHEAIGFFHEPDRYRIKPADPRTVWIVFSRGGWVDAVVHSEATAKSLAGAIEGRTYATFIEKVEG